MDPYLVLGLPRNCTRRQVQEVFRAKARNAHPDLGGDEREFIHICTAYRTILADLESSGSSQTSDAASEADDRPRRRNPKFADKNYHDLLLNIATSNASGDGGTDSWHTAAAGDTSSPGSGDAIGGLVALIIILGQILIMFMIAGR